MSNPWVMHLISTQDVQACLIHLEDPELWKYNSWHRATSAYLPLWGSAVRGSLPRPITGIAEICHRAITRLISHLHHCKCQNSCRRYRALPLYSGPLCPQSKGELRRSSKTKPSSVIDTCFWKALFACDVLGSEGAVPWPDARHCPTARAPTSPFLLSSPAAWPCCPMPGYLSLPLNLSFIPTTWSCNCGPLPSTAWKTCLMLMNKCDMDQGGEWWQRPLPTCCTCNLLLGFLVLTCHLGMPLCSV